MFLKQEQNVLVLSENGSIMKFLEIETPILQSEAGGAEARPFITHHNTLDIPLYLNSYKLLKKNGWFEKVYELGRIFRNEGISTKHNPEIISVEIYQAFSNYVDMMDLTEEMIKDIVATWIFNSKLSK